MCRKQLKGQETGNISVVVVVFTLTRIIKSVVTGQAPAEEYPREKHKQPKVVHAYITADAIHASTRNIKVKSGVSLRCARSIPVHTSHYSRL